MTGSPLPLESLGDSRSTWLGGEAHVRSFGRAARRPGRSLGCSRLALALVFLTGGLVGAGLTGLMWRAQKPRRLPQSEQGG